MPRIRSIKPDLWNDEKLGNESEAVVLTYVGLWTFSDDYAVVKANIIWLKNQIYPYKDKLRIDTFSSWLKRIEELDLVIPFTYRGESFYYIRNFRKHQKVEKPSKARNCPEDELVKLVQIHSPTPLPEYYGNTPRPLPDHSPTEGDIGRGKGKGGGSAPDLSPDRPSHAPTWEAVYQCFYQLGKPDEAKGFFEYWEGLHWMKGISPIQNFASFANRWVTNHISKDQDLKNKPGISETDQEFIKIFGK